VALYFSLRHRPMNKSAAPPEVWAIDQIALDGVASERSRRADLQASNDAPGSHRVSSIDSATDLDTLQQESEKRRKMLSSALAPDTAHQRFFNRHGLVVSALPPVENQRLSSQQGTFLFSGADEKTFEQSLSTMMTAYKGEWCQRFKLTEDVVPEAEARLFQMNIHDLSLFPDAEGLGGFVRQKARLLWG
jgi:hypothetical protein